MKKNNFDNNSNLNIVCICISFINQIKKIYIFVVWWCMCVTSRLGDQLKEKCFKVYNKKIKNLKIQFIQKKE